MIRSRYAVIALVVLVSAAAALLHVWVHLGVIALGYEISRETNTRHDLQEANQRLSLELRTRMDLSVVERLARDELKMVAPDPRAMRVVALGGTATANPTEAGR